MLGIGSDPFGQQAQGQDADYGRDLPGRIMASEYNLAVQRGDGPQAAGIFARMLGQWLANRFGR